MALDVNPHSNEPLPARPPARPYLEVAAEVAAQEVADHPAHREVERAEAVEAHLDAVHVLHLKVCHRERGQECNLCHN